ncbi:MAG: ABC transporter permease [Peptostreptococcaceae bacterium]
MSSVIKWEMKKNLRLGTIALWIFGLVLSYVCIRTNQNVSDTYADIFSKYYGLAPIMGIIMFTMFSGSFILEYNSNMDGLIKASKSGTKQLILAKFIANGICASIVNLSVLILIVSKPVFKFGVNGLDLPLKSLWYFGNSGSNITVLQMLLIVSITTILGSFLFAAIGLYLSSINEKATTPFIVGGIILGLPYLGMLPQVITLNSPLYGMYSQLLIRYGAPVSSWIVFVGIVLVGTTILYNLTKKSFVKER